jgi:hypothetical protein
VDKDLADSWSMIEVVRRWHHLYQGTLLSQKYQKGDKPVCRRTARAI